MRWLLYELLRIRKYNEALLLLPTGLQMASYRDITSTISDCPPELRPQLIVMLRDVLNGFPHLLYGIPVLVSYSPLGDTMPAELPLPSELPNNALTAAWYPLDVRETSLPLMQQQGSIITLSPHAHTCAILRMRTIDEAVIEEPSSAWWADTLRLNAQYGSIYVSATRVMPWIDALDAAYVMYARSQSVSIEQSQTRFLTTETLEWAIDAGEQFQRMAF